MMVEDRKALATEHLAAIDAHLRDNDAKHSPVIVTILSTLHNMLAPMDEETTYDPREPLTPVENV